MNELHLFAGDGGGILGGMLGGDTPVCAVEIEPHRRATLLARQRDGFLPRFPVWDDVRTFDGNPWRGIAHAVSGGFPCQDVSALGTGDGLDGERSGLWVEMRRIVREVRPWFVRVENSPMLVVRGLMRILGELAEMGYDANWGIMGHHNAKGNIQRSRLWLLASTAEGRLQRRNVFGPKRRQVEDDRIEAFIEGALWPDVSNPRAFGSIDDLADRVERTKAIGDGQVPSVAWMAWKALDRWEDDEL